MPETKFLFNNVARHYDILNSLFSFGMDKLWRRRLVRELSGTKMLLDVATGTAEVAIEFVNKFPDCYAIGIDPSPNMLNLAHEKFYSLKHHKRINLIQGIAEYLPFPSNTFDTTTITFGIRNTLDPLKSLKEMHRVLKPQGKLGVMEFAVPKNKIFSPIYMFYLNNIFPLVGSLFGTRDEYKYLGASISNFPQRSNFIQLMGEAGFTTEKLIEISLGSVILYVGVKNN